MRINEDDLNKQQKIKTSARQSAQNRVKALIKQVQYQSYLNAGFSPMDAAKKVGIKGLKFWKFHRPGEVERKIKQELEKGE